MRLGGRRLTWLYVKAGSLLDKSDTKQQQSEGAKEDSGTFWLVGTL